MGYDLVTFGEAMVRLSPPHFQRLEQTNALDVNIGGAELNVAIAAQRLGLRCAYVTRLTDNPLGRMIANKAREHGIDVSHIVWTREDRVGLYFVEFGASPRASSVLYDRANSAMSKIRTGEVDWDKVFQDSRAFHTTGITPALSSSAAEATKEAVRKAKEKGVLVSLDLNYRARLWSPEEARRVMTELISQADILITTEEDAEKVLGVKESSFERMAERLNQMFQNLQVVAVTVRETPSVWRNTWTALAYSQGKIFHGPVFDIEIVDRLGAGDAFAGGFLYGFLTQNVETGLRFGLAISALKQTNPGDFVWATKEECERILAGPGLRIVR
ncbi:MAG: sugar kinase [Candidatus Bathyarchaeia archaeon]